MKKLACLFVFILTYETYSWNIVPCSDGDKWAFRYATATVVADACIERKVEIKKRAFKNKRKAMRWWRENLQWNLDIRVNSYPRIIDRETIEDGR